MRAIAGRSVHREESERVEEARIEAFTDGVNACLGWLVARGDVETAQRMREHFCGDDVEQGRAAE